MDTTDKLLTSVFVLTVFALFACPFYSDYNKAVCKEQAIAAKYPAAEIQVLCK